MDSQVMIILYKKKQTNKKYDGQFPTIQIHKDETEKNNKKYQKTH
jgi:hypothetical protein